MTCLNQVAKPSPAQGKDSTSSMAAGLHNCTTGQKTRVSAPLRVLEQCVMYRICPDLYDSALEASRADRIPSHGVLRLHIRRAPARIWNARATVAFPYPANQMQLMSATARSGAGDQRRQSWPGRGPRLGRRRWSESQEYRGFC
jgi:hypothetical protein